VRNPLIAIVDDDEGLCFSLVDLMRSVGYRAEPFFEAERLIASPDMSAYDCIIADVRMPGMSGLDLVRKLRERGDLTPVILVTALPDRKLEDEAISVGAHSLLRKPLDTQTLLDRVARSLGSERALR
jgi:FixJ family two-component response regulator